MSPSTPTVPAPEQFPTDRNTDYLNTGPCQSATPIQPAIRRCGARRSHRRRRSRGRRRRAVGATLGESGRATLSGVHPGLRAHRCRG